VGEDSPQNAEEAKIDRLIHEPARFMIMAHLYVVESSDFLFLIRSTGLTWGNLSSHMNKLEASGYVAIEKEFLDKKPHTMARLTDAGRVAFDEYRHTMKHMLEDMPKP
jgi:DNA-binding MarR family transcriptional regulator